MRVLILIIFVCFRTQLFGQGFIARNYAPNCSDNMSRMVYETSPGNYIAGGYSTDTATGTQVNKLVLMGINSTGQILWTKKYGNAKLEFLSNDFIKRCFYKQGNYLYYAGCMKDSLGKQIGTLIKFNFNGDTLWQKIYRDSDPLEDVIPQMLGSSVDGGFLVTGIFQNNGTSPYDKSMVIKTNASGVELWRRKIGPSVQDGRVIIQDSASKKIVIAGSRFWNGTVSDNIVVLDSLGYSPQQTSFEPGVAYDMIQTKDKKFLVVGFHYYPQTVGGYNLMRSYAVKFDVNNLANPIWRIDGFDKLELNNAFCSISEFNNGNVIVGGMIDTMQLHNLPVIITNRFTKIDVNGNVIWNRYYEYPTVEANGQVLSTVDVTSDGGWVAAIKRHNVNTNPFFFVKYDSTGCDSTIAYCQSIVGIKKYGNLQSDISFYPNPATDVLNVEIRTHWPDNNREISFVDISGREVKRVQLSENGSVSVSDLSPGIYFVNLYNNNRIVYKDRLVKQ